MPLSRIFQRLGVRSPVFQAPIGAIASAELAAAVAPRRSAGIGKSCADGHPGRLRQAGGHIIEQGETACCYAKSEKAWIDDSAGISWETFHTTGDSIVYGDGSGENVARVAHEKQGACCVPETRPAKTLPKPLPRPLPKPAKTTACC